MFSKEMNKKRVLSIEEKNFLKHIGNVIKTKRCEKDVGQYSLGFDAKLDESSISRYENGLIDMQVVPLKRIADILEFPMEDYFKDFRPDNPDSTGNNPDRIETVPKRDKHEFGWKNDIRVALASFINYVIRDQRHHKMRNRLMEYARLIQRYKSAKKEKSSGKIFRYKKIYRRGRR